MTRIFVDAIGLVRDDGAEYYAVSSEFDVKAVLAHPWLRDHVMGYLPAVEIGMGVLSFDLTHPDVKPRAQIRDEVAAFILSAPDPQLWAYYSAYDHVVLAQLFGRMVDMPRGIPMWTADLKQRMRNLGVTGDQLPKQTANEHHALFDARHDRDIAVFLDGLGR